MYYKFVSTSGKILDVSDGLVVYKKAGRRLRKEKSGPNTNYRLTVGLAGELHDDKIYVTGDLEFDTEHSYPTEPMRLVKISMSEYETLKSVVNENHDIYNVATIEDTSTLDYVRNSVIANMSEACNKRIISGINIVLSDGKSHHVDLTETDQINLLALSVELAIFTDKEAFAYHCAGELEKLWSKKDIQDIILTANNYRNYHLSYFNSLKSYIKSVDIETAKKIIYGMPIPEEYQSDTFKTALLSFKEGW